MSGVIDFPALKAEHLREARLFADRRDLILALALPPAPVVLEVGVAHGEFSAFLIEALKPSRFMAADLFTMHELELAWGVPTRELLRGMAHADFYRQRFAGADCALELIAGDTRQTLPGLPDQSCDLIYIDAGHDYVSVASDAAQAARAVRPDGLLVFNDYVMTDHLRGETYGVVQAVNQLVAGTDWKVIGLALQHQMFCDIALSRRTGSNWR